MNFCGYVKCSKNIDHPSNLCYCKLYQAPRKELLMNKYFTVLESEEGLVHIITKAKWLGIIPMPHTSVVPHRSSDLARLGTFIRWEPTDRTDLKTLHDAVIHLVRERGISGVADIASSEKRTERVAKTMGLSWRELSEEAVKSRAPIPDLDAVLKHVKRFM